MGMCTNRPLPFVAHQSVVVRADGFCLMRTSGERTLGKWVLRTVVLDREAGLVLQPRSVFCFHRAARHRRDRVWGAPDSGGRSGILPAPNTAIAR